MLSVLAVALASGLCAPSLHAATYYVANQAQLVAAINSANADGAPTSTIYLSSNITLANPALVPVITKNLLIASDPALASNFVISSTANHTFNAAAGVTFTIDSRLQSTGSTSNRNLILTGPGTVALTGGASLYSGNLQVSGTGAQLHLSDAAVFTAGAGVLGSLYLNGDGTVLTATGAGTTLNLLGIGEISSVGGATLNVESGATVNITANQNSSSYMVGRTGEQGTVNVTGAGSLLSVTTLAPIGNNGFDIGLEGQGDLNVTNGGHVAVNGLFAVGGRGLGTFPNSWGEVLLTGPTSRLDVQGTSYLQKGTMTVSDQAVFDSTAGINVGAAPSSNFQVLVTGAGSLMQSGGNTAVANGANAAGGLTVTNNAALVVGGSLNVAAGSGANGSVTLSNGATATVGGGTGIVALTTTNASSTATLNIGGAVGQAAESAGTLNASVVQFGIGTGSLNFNHTDSAYTFGLAVQGPGTVNHTGPGTTILSGTNTYTGGTNLNAGVLQVANDTNLGGVASTLTFNGGTLHTTGSITTARTVALAGAGTIDTDAATTLQLGSAVNGVGSLAKQGAGTLVLDANAGYTGGTTIAQGTLQLGNGGTAGTVVGNVANDGTLAFNRSDIATFSGVVSGSGAVVQQGTGTTVLTADNTYSGGTTITQGTLQIGDGGTLGSIVGNVANDGTLAFNRSDDVTFAGLVSGTGALAHLGSGTTVLTADNTYTGGTTITQGILQLGNGGTTGSIVGDVVNDGTLAFDRSDSTTFAGLVSGTGNLHQAGTGVVTLTADNTYTGGTTITQGTLQLGNGGTTGSIVGDVANDGTLAIDRSDNLTLAGVISGIGSLQQQGVGTTVLTADNTYTGSTTIAQGTLQLGNGGTTGSVTGAIANDGVLAINRSDTYTLDAVVSGTGQLHQVGTGTTVLNTDQTYTGGTVITAGALHIGDGGTTGSIVGDVVNDAVLAFNRSDTVTFAGVVSGAGAVQQIGSGTTVLTGDSTYSGGTSITSGALQLGNGGTTGSIVGNVANDAVLSFNRSDAVTFAGAVSGTGAVQQVGSGTTVLTGDNTYTGGTSITSGTLQLGNGGTTGSIVGDVANDAVLAFNRSDAITFAGTVSGAGALHQIGSGTTVLTADNTYTGGTRIDAGTLQLGNGGTTGSVAGDITNDGVLAINRSDTYTLSSVVSGSGQLHQMGSGTTVVTAAQAYTGGTVISAGTLQIGDGGTTGSIVGDVLNNATLAVNRADNFTLAGVVSGTGGLRQIGAGTLTLLGANSYSGGTALKTGRIDVGHNLALGTGLLSMDDGTTLGFVANGLNIANDILLTGNNDPIVDTGAFDATLSGDITGAGFLTKTGSGVLTLTGANTHTGATNVSQGTVRAGMANTFSAASAHTVATGAVLDLAGFNQTIASMNNAGLVSVMGSAPGTTLTVLGPWVGTGGTLRLATALGNDASVTDRLVLDGPTAVASGTTTVLVVNVGGLGAQTTGNGIEIITALNGATTTAQTTRDAFTLSGGRVTAGAYDYQLFAGDMGGAGENWYLRSTSYRLEAPLFAAQPEQLRMAGLAMVGNLHLRIGDDRPGAPDTRHAWGRLISSERNVSQTGTVSPQSGGRLHGFQAGTDLWTNPEWRAGLYVGQLEGEVHVSGDTGNGAGRQRLGRIDLRNQYLGGYATYRNKDGFYADTVLQFGRHDYTLKPDGLVSTAAKGNSWLVSLEVGQPFRQDGDWEVEPQLQLVHQRMDLDRIAVNHADVTYQLDSQWMARAGVRVKGRKLVDAGVLQPYLRFNLYRSSSGTDVASFKAPGAVATPIASGTGGTSAELALGATLDLSRSTSLYGELGQMWAAGGASRTSGGINASAGLRVRW